MLGRIRTFVALALVVLVTVPMLLAQLLVVRTGLFDDRKIPHLWHRFILRVLDFRLSVHGGISERRPLLLVANHISWTDIMVMGAVAELHFISKAEVKSWPVFGTFARLQRTVFVEREKKRRSGDQASEIARRLNDDDPMVLFAEGVTSDGNLLMPFKTTLFGAASMAVDGGAVEAVSVQPVAIAYPRFHGMPMGRQHRPHISWIGDNDLVPHILALLREGAVDVEVHFGAPVEYRRGDSRKQVAQEVERRVRDMFTAALRDARARK